MVPRNDTGWFVRNVADAAWFRSAEFGLRCVFEPIDDRFESVGVGIKVVEPGQPACCYHRENAQEDFLVLAGACTLLVAGEEHSLRAWDFVHCPPGVDHVFVGAGSGPCAILMIGHRPKPHDLYYPESELARVHEAEAAEATDDPRKAYARATRPEPCAPPPWPVSG